MRRVAAGAVVALAGLVLWAGPAGAHAELRETSPRRGEQLAESPAEIVLTFTEPVDAVPGGVRVYDGSGERVDRGGRVLEEGHGETVLLELPRLQDGAYVVTWRVASADSHPVRGAFTFRVGDAPGREPRALAARLLAADGGDPLVGGLHALARLLELAALLILVGALWFSVTWSKSESVPRAVAAVIAVGLLVGALSSLALLVLQGPYAAGLGVESAFDPSLIAAVAQTRFGVSVVARLALLAIGSFLVSWVLRPGPARRWVTPAKSAVVTLGFGLLATVTAAGHAGSGRWVPLALATDLVHLAAGSLWLGGLVVAVVMLRRRADNGSDAVRVVRRFSVVAFWAVLALLASGTLQSIRQVGEPAALTGTTYGKLLLAKLSAFAVMVLVAGASRRLVRRASAAPDPREPPALQRLRRSIALEVAVSAVLLGATALLVNAVPGRDALALPYATDVRAGAEVVVDISVEPAKAGPLDLHLYTLSRSGAPLEVKGMEASLSLEGRDIGPLLVPLVRAGPAHFVSYGFDLPVPGAWRLSLVVEEESGRRVGAQVTLPVR